MSKSKGFGSRISVPRGEKHHSAILTEHKVQAARTLHINHDFPCKLIAKLASVKYGTIWDLLNYNTWKQIPDLEMEICSAIRILQEK